ncbi:hypothetical protein GC169_00080 [bacterium]|nr:hypothetical protein [bacterium]
MTGPPVPDGDQAPAAPLPDPSDAARQLRLAFPRASTSHRPLIETAPYAPALSLLRRWSDWPGGQLALTGPPASGKSRLLAEWSRWSGAGVLDARRLAAASLQEIAEYAARPLAIDDAHLVPESAGETLLAALNIARSRGAPVLLSGVDAPSGWATSPPDLVSRLKAAPTIAISDPDEETLTELLIEESARRFLTLPRETAAFLVARMERSYAEVTALCDRLERDAGASLSRLSAGRIVADRLSGDAEGAADDPDV